MYDLNTEMCMYFKFLFSLWSLLGSSVPSRHWEIFFQTSDKCSTNIHFAIGLYQLLSPSRWLIMFLCVV